nr:MAG TPA: hypothetical protein [Caudoviricetes sp.]
MPDYNSYGETEIIFNEWLSIQKYTKEHLSEKAQNALVEIQDWINDVFAKEGVFTILGI